MQVYCSAEYDVNESAMFSLTAKKEPSGEPKGRCMAIQNHMDQRLVRRHWHRFLQHGSGLAGDLSGEAGDHFV